MKKYFPNPPVNPQPSNQPLVPTLPVNPPSVPRPIYHPMPIPRPNVSLPFIPPPIRSEVNIQPLHATPIAFSDWKLESDVRYNVIGTPDYKDIRDEFIQNADSLQTRFSVQKGVYHTRNGYQDTDVQYQRIVEDGEAELNMLKCKAFERLFEAFPQYLSRLQQNYQSKFRMYFRQSNPAPDDPMWTNVYKEGILNKLTYELRKCFIEIINEELT